MGGSLLWLKTRDFKTEIRESSGTLLFKSFR